MRVADPDLKDLERRMNGAIEVLKQEFAGLRTGRASVHLLEPINVAAYGAATPMNQVGTIGVPEPRMITVQVWDRSLVGAVERAIRESDLGLNPQTEGQLIRVPIPMLSEERRVELGKIAHKYAEQSRIAVRNVRRDGMDTLKRMEREHELSQDEQRMWSDEIQEMTDRHIKSIDETLAQKDSEIMQV
jgi:ribosome recycling factor